MAVRIQVLGQVRAWRDGESVDLGSAGQRAVLGLLALADGKPVTRGMLVHALWGDHPPPTAVNILQTRVKHLRRVLEPDRPPRRDSALIPRVGDGYRLCAPPGGVDLAEFRRLVRLAGQDRDASRLGEALRLWRGDPLIDVPALHRHPALLALVEEWRGALTRYADAMLAEGHADRAVQLLAEAAAAHPLDEAVQSRLIRAYQAAGQRAQAFATYQAVRAQLVRELGVDPGPELAAAHDALLRDDPPPRPDAGHGAPAAPQPAVPAELPADVVGFVGRQAELVHLDRLAFADGPGPTTALRVLAVTGTPGVGKTALAIRWAHRVRERFPDGQLYVDLRGHDPEPPLSAADALARALRSLGLPAGATPSAPGERAARLRSMLAGRRMLLVLDSAASVEQVRPLLPGTGDCVVLVTSRDSLAGLVAGHGAARLEVDLLPLHDAVSLFTRLRAPAGGSEPDAAAALALRCARLPLALRIAAELALVRGSGPLAGLVEELSDPHRRLELLSGGQDARTSVTAVFSWSYARLPDPAARMLRLLGLHPGPDIDSYALAALCGTDLAAARRAIDVLVRAHLVRRCGDDRYQLHELLRAYAARLVLDDDEESRHAALTRLLTYYRVAAAAATDTLPPAERHRAEHPAERHRAGDRAGPCGSGPVPPACLLGQDWLDRERANLVAAAVHASRYGWPEHGVALTRALLRYVERGGRLEEAATLHMRALRAGRVVGMCAGRRA
ncbi:MAG TPA: BTAD domain-containing putative transcriptional regulator [Pilimelia sp.]|nr:BTAD domain-containing putative transcriptional regulator [Pilimelia sp.]